jgi:hypothetical protein
MIYRFTYDGKLVHSKGQLGVRGRGPNTFDRPTDIAWLPDGTFFISDGYGGVRVAKFDKDGKFLMDWGKAPADPKNPGPNEWNTVHSIGISKDRKLYVVDRGHRRMQVFDENGKFLDMWTTGVNSSPYYHFITTDQNAFAVANGLEPFDERWVYTNLYENHAEYHPGNSVDIWGSSLTATWQLSDTISLKSITAYRDMIWDSGFDLELQFAMQHQSGGGIGAGEDGNAGIVEAFGHVKHGVVGILI